MDKLSWIRACAPADCPMVFNNTVDELLDEVRSEARAKAFNDATVQILHELSQLEPYGDEYGLMWSCKDVQEIIGHIGRKTLPYERSGYERV